VADIGFFTSEPLNDARADAATATCDQSNFSRQAGDRPGFFVIGRRSFHHVRPFPPWILFPKNSSVNNSRSRVMIALILVERRQ
jgi:hypothetical protein